MQNKRRNVAIGILIGSIFFYSFYLKERLAFNKAKESKTLTSMQSYFLDYPSGRYVKELELIELVRKWVEYPINVIIKYVDEFPNYKFEQFVCKIK